MRGGPSSLEVLETAGSKQMNTAVNLNPKLSPPKAHILHEL